MFVGAKGHLEESEELGVRPGTVETDDAEVFGTDLLDTRMGHAVRLPEGRCRATRAPRYLMRDRDDFYGYEVRQALKSLDIEEVVIAAGSPWQCSGPA